MWETTRFAESQIDVEWLTFKIVRLTKIQPDNSDKHNRFRLEEIFLSCLSLSEDIQISQHQTFWFDSLAAFSTAYMRFHNQAIIAHSFLLASCDVSCLIQIQNLTRNPPLYLFYLV